MVWTPSFSCPGARLCQGDECGLNGEEGRIGTQMWQEDVIRFLLPCNLKSLTYPCPELGGEAGGQLGQVGGGQGCWPGPGI